MSQAPIDGVRSVMVQEARLRGGWRTGRVCGERAPGSGRGGRMIDDRVALAGAVRLTAAQI
jgi:hypothetical protein